MSAGDRLTKHAIIGTQAGRQGAGQTCPEDLVLCHSCGWMLCSEYHRHIEDIVAVHEDAARAEERERAERAERALEALGRERNTWARQQADLRDERDTAVGEAEKIRGNAAATENDLIAMLTNVEAERDALAATVERVRALADADETKSFVRKADLLAALDTPAPEQPDGGAA